MSERRLEAWIEWVMSDVERRERRREEERRWEEVDHYDFVMDDEDE